MDALRALVYEIFLETFLEREKKLMFYLMVFYISHESGVQTQNFT